MQRAGVDANYRELVSAHGHDGFLADAERLAPIVKAQLDKKELPRHSRMPGVDRSLIRLDVR